MENIRLNKLLAQSTGMSRRAADKIIQEGAVSVNGKAGTLGQQVSADDVVFYNGNQITLDKSPNFTTIILNKPVGYVCSRNGQGNPTIYEVLPQIYHHLKPVGRLDKHSSGLLLLTGDGQLAYELTHPKFNKTKQYKIALNSPLQPLHRQLIADKGIMLEDGISKLHLERINDTDDTNWKVIMSEGRNRQIRRTFESLGYNVVKLHRTHFGPYELDNLKPKQFKNI